MEPSPQELTTQIKTAGSFPQKLLMPVAEHHQHFNAIHTSTALSQLAAAPRPEQLEAMQHPAWVMLLSALNGHASTMGRRTISSVFWALARLQLQPRPDALLRKLLQVAIDTLPAYAAQSMANMLWGLAKLGYHPGRNFIMAVEQQLPASLETAKVQEVSINYWALAVWQHPPVVGCLAALAERFLLTAHAATSQKLQTCCGHTLSCAARQEPAGARCTADAGQASCSWASRLESDPVVASPAGVVSRRGIHVHRHRAPAAPDGGQGAAGQPWHDLEPV